MGELDVAFFAVEGYKGHGLQQKRGDTITSWPWQ